MTGEALAPVLRIKLQIYSGEEIAMGPGKADLLDAIAREGSISGAGRAMGMSYRRAWLLVDVMNRCWASPLVEAHPGVAGKAGAGRGGARLTDEGRVVLGLYRGLQAEAGVAGKGESWRRLAPALLAQPRAHQGD